MKNESTMPIGKARMVIIACVLMASRLVFRTRLRWTDPIALGAQWFGLNTTMAIRKRVAPKPGASAEAFPVHHDYF
jgi:hypothetical protein